MTHDTADRMGDLEDFRGIGVVEGFCGNGLVLRCVATRIEKGLECSGKMGDDVGES